MSAILKKLKEAVLNIIKREPVRVATYAVGAIVAVAASLGIIVPSADVTQIVALLVVILGGGEAARSRVTPIK